MKILKLVLLTPFPGKGFLRTVILFLRVYSVLQEMARRTVWLHRVYTHQPPADPNAPAPSPQEAELKRRLDSIHQILKGQLVEKHILRLSVKYSEGGLQPDLPEHAQYVAEVTAQLTSSLRNIVDTIIDEDQAKVERNESNISTFLSDLFQNDNGATERVAE